MDRDSAAFSEEQKEYLQGFMAGALQRIGQPFAGMTSSGHITSTPEEAVRGLDEPADGPPPLFGTPYDELCREERIKLERNPLDIWDEIVANAEADRFPEGPDVFRYKFHGLFQVAPAQDAFMLRCRIPGCVLTATQLHALAGIAERSGGGYADVTTRGNVQIREIPAREAANVLHALYEVGLTSRGAGADNVRNITATPTSGFDPTEVCDVLPYARALHYYILNSRDLYGLPRKFNVSFDSGGAVSVASDTNDIGFVAVRVTDAPGIAPGVYFRVLLGGITGHGDFARDTGLLVPPSQVVAVATAMIRVFLEHGDRTNRKRARLKYLIERWGVERFLAETQQKLALPLPYAPPDACEPRRPVVRHGHLGAHPQNRPGLNYVGVAIPVGRMQASQMHALADLAATMGQGEVRLTVFQNMILPGVPDVAVPALEARLVEIGFHHRAACVSGGLVACTGNTGCKFALTDTKDHGVMLGRYLESRVVLDHPINIHLTGCPNSCAQHYVGDIGLLGVKTEVDGVSVEAYNVLVGGGMDHEQGLARELVRAVPVAGLPGLLEGVLQTYLAHRAPDESFLTFTRRHSTDDLKTLFAA